MKALPVYVAVWKWGGWVLVGPSKDYPGFMKQQLDTVDELKPNIGGHTTIDEDKPWVLWVPDLCDHAVLAHEAFHVAYAVLDTRGVKLSVDSEEAFAYTIEHVVRTVMEAKPEQWETYNEDGSFRQDGVRQDGPEQDGRREDGSRENGLPQNGEVTHG